jgi:hypothetical protein
MTKLLPPLTKTLFWVAVSSPVLLSLEAVKDMAAADAYQWAGLIFKTLGAGVTTAVALLSFRNNHQTPPTP